MLDRQQEALVKQIHKTISVKATPAEVWNCWTTLKGIQTFFAPSGQIELWPGGSYDIWFFPENPPGQRGAEGVKVLSFLPNKMLSFEWDAPPKFPNVRKQRTWVVIEIIPVEKNQTQIELTHLGWRDGEEWDQVHQYFTAAWDVVLGRLVKRFTEGPMDWANLE